MKLNEKQLKQIIRESVTNILNEYGYGSLQGGSSAPSSRIVRGSNGQWGVGSQQGGAFYDPYAEDDARRMNDAEKLNQQNQGDFYKNWCEKNWGDLQKAARTRGCRAYALAREGRYKEAYDAY